MRVKSAKDQILEGIIGKGGVRELERRKELAHALDLAEIRLETERKLAAIRKTEIAVSAEPIPEPLNQIASDPEISRRCRLLAEYKAATKNVSNRQIYAAKNSGIHKPQFYEWLNGTLPSTSATAIAFERFLAAKKPPVPKKPKQ
jgi:hypothetical protein